MWKCSLSHKTLVIYIFQLTGMFFFFNCPLVPNINENPHIIYVFKDIWILGRTTMFIMCDLGIISSCAEVASWKLLGVCPALALIFEILRFKFIVKRCSNQSHIHPPLHNLDFNLKAHGWICEIYERDREGGAEKETGK